MLDAAVRLSASRDPTVSERRLAKPADWRRRRRGILWRTHICRRAIDRDGGIKERNETGPPAERRDRLTAGRATNDRFRDSAHGGGSKNR